MLDVCSSSWQMYDCEWSLRNLWRWTNWVGRLDLIVLALTLSYVIAIAFRVFSQYRRTPLRGRADATSLKELAADLRVDLGILKGISSAAPYLGLVGACVGILSASGFSGSIAMEWHAFQVMIASSIAVALVTTAAGILVAIPATFLGHYFRTRIELLDNEASTATLEQRGGHFQLAGKFPLKRKFSQLPSFALIAAPGLAALVAVFTPFFAPREATGLGVDLAPTRCEMADKDRLIVLHISNAGELDIDLEREDWKHLGGRLSEIYSMREHRTLYLLADEEVSFQTVADLIDIVENAQSSTNAENLEIRVRLITPEAMKFNCLYPVRTLPIRLR